MSNKLTNLWMLLMLCQRTWCTSINCVTEQSATSAGVANATTSISCSNSTYTLVSCGFNQIATDENNVGGSWIIEQTCYARNVDSTSGVVALARCCDLSEYSVSCNTLESQISGTIDDDKIDVTCPASQTLMGCTARPMGDRMDGSYPGKESYDWWDFANTTVSNQDSCTGWNAGSGGGIRSYATCCSSHDNKVTFECDAVGSASSTASDIYFSCPNANQFMTSCSAANAYRDMNRWGIGSGNDCKVHNSHNEDGFGIAICCTVTTLSPTSNPTSATPAPTSNPTPVTDNPTSAPTIAPTIDDRHAGVDISTTQTSQVTNAPHNKKGISGRNGVQLLDYLLFTIVGALFVILLFIFFIVVQKKRHKRADCVEGIRMVAAKSVSVDTGDTNVEHKIANDNNDMHMVNLAQQQMNPMPPEPNINNVNMEQNNMEYREGLDNVSTPSGKDLVTSTPLSPKVTTQGYIKDEESDEDDLMYQQSTTSGTTSGTTVQ